MAGVLSELAGTIARRNEADLEVQLTAAVSRHLGGKNWEWSELVGRVVAVVSCPDKSQLNELDSVPILRVSSRTEVGDNLVISSRVYEQL